VKKIALRTTFALILTLGPAIAAPPVIGMVTAVGAFRLNGDTVIANGTLTEGAVLENGPGTSWVRLTGGARLSLSSDSRGKLYSDHIILEKGETSLENGVGFYLEALGLRIRPDRGISTGQVGLLNSSRVRVAALTGSFRVLNARGVLVANVAAGSALAFEPLVPVSAAVTHITGTLKQQSGHFLLMDQVTRVVVEVTGQGLAPHVGRVVQVTGTLNAAATPVAGASQVIAATSLQMMIAPVAGGGATGGGAAAAGAGGASTGMRIGATTSAIVGGVAATATLGGLAASGALPKPSPSTPVGVPAGPPVTPPGPPPGRPPGQPPVTPPGPPPGRPPVTPPEPRPISR
jgi:hypothetical protein